ncbi:conserved hypothetical protein [Mucor ambiguus]|uniref:Uncharacterized protein n=1 Tax=Mucor ambiguus TaxID=91626 RepID=A0A0C9LUI3_9FUNG|nr:conserved hypothetical protein [Mucor ambiguus]
MLRPSMPDTLGVVQSIDSMPPFSTAEVYYIVRQIAMVEAVNVDVLRIQTLGEKHRNPGSMSANSNVGSNFRWRLVKCHRLEALFLDRQTILMATHAYKPLKDIDSTQNELLFDLYVKDDVSRLRASGAVSRYPYPKDVWSPAGGWWSRPKTWKTNTLVAAFGMAVTLGAVWKVSADKEVRYQQPKRWIPSMMWAKQFKDQQ